jgi:hypothetical protein
MFLLTYGFVISEVSMTGTKTEAGLVLYNWQIMAYLPEQIK